MPRRRGRKRRAPEPETNDRWLITYSDLITLLMIFFVIMYAMSKIDVAKFETLTQSLAAALHQEDQVPLHDLGTSGLVVPANPTDNGDKTQHPNAMTTAQQNQQVQQQLQAQNDAALDNLYKEVQSYISAHNLQGNVTVLNQERGIQITLRDVVLFDSGQAAVKPQAQGLLKGLVPFFQTLSNPIVVEGYTDNVPISTPQYPTNWELSSARAIGVVEYFITTGVNPSRLSGVGYGEYHPAVPNDSEAHRQMNRRINIVIMRYLPDTQVVTPTQLENSASSGKGLASSGTSAAATSGEGTDGADGGTGGADNGSDGALGTVTPINPIQPISPINPIQGIAPGTSGTAPASSTTGN